MSNPYNTCDTVLPDHICNPCPDNREFGRVRGVALIAKDYRSTLIADDPTLSASWTAGITAGKIIVIPETAGDYDPGDPKELKGYGDRKSSYGVRTQKCHFYDPNYFENYAFWNSITDATQFVIAFRTSSIVHIADEPASIFAKDGVADDLEAEVVWDVNAMWQSKNIPSVHDATNLIVDIFSCPN